LNNTKTKNEVIIAMTDGPRRKIKTFNPDGTRKRGKGKRNTGAGVLMKLGNETMSTHSYGMGRKTNIYDGESLALLAGIGLATQLHETNKQIKSIYLYSDSSRGSPT